LHGIFFSKVKKSDNNNPTTEFCRRIIVVRKSKLLKKFSPGKILWLVEKMKVEMEFVAGSGKIIVAGEFFGDFMAGKKFRLSFGERFLVG
jgi:hypothetical protein